MASESESVARYTHKNPKELSGDPSFLRKIQKKLRNTFSERSTNGGVLVLSEGFLHMDRCIRSDNFESDIWGFKSIFKGAMGSRISDLELSTLFNVFDDEEDGVVDMAECMMTLRKSFCCTSQQFHQIVKRLRSKKLDPSNVPFSSGSPADGNSEDPAPPSNDAELRSAMFSYLTTVAHLSQSEAFLFLDYCTPHDAEIAFPSAFVPPSSLEGTIDSAYCYTILFSEVIPDDIAFPLLIAKVVEAACDVDNPNTGTIGLENCLAQCMLQKDNDGKVWLDKSSFRRFNTIFSGGLSSGECDQLFSYLNDPNSNLMDTSIFVTNVSQRFPRPSEVDLQAAREIVRGLVLATPDGLNKLHLSLARFSNERPLTLMEFTTGVRRGLSSSSSGFASIADIVLEYLHLESPSCVEFVLAMRGQLSAGREQLLGQLFHKLDEDDDLIISKDLMFNSFHSDRFLDDCAGLNKVDWVRNLSDFLSSIPEGTEISLAEFEYYWGNVSAAIPEDVVFSLMLWKSHNMHTSGRGVASVPRAVRSNHSDFGSPMKTARRMLRQ